ncbi:MAG: NAD(P)-dependent oxidoreductase [Bacteroidota bacterium]
MVDNQAILSGIKKGIIKGYLADVLEEEPIRPNHPFVGVKEIMITPHIGSRTYESVEKQGLFAVRNAKQILNV